MTVQIELPESVEQILREGGRDPGEAFLETALIGLYREGKLFHSQLANLLNVSRYELDGMLKARGILYDMTVEELEADIEGLRRLLGAT